MMSKAYLILAVAILSLSSCLKRSIADAMLETSGRKKVTARFRYEINGKEESVTIENADRQCTGTRMLVCEKTNVYVLSAVLSVADFIFTFNTDSLRAGNYKYLSSYGPAYVTTFEGRPQYVYGASDHMNVNITSVADGHISGNFSGQLTPAIVPGYPNNVYGAAGSVVIRNGSFTDVPICY